MITTLNPKLYRQARIRLKDGTEHDASIGIKSGRAYIHEVVKSEFVTPDTLVMHKEGEYEIIT